MRDATAPVLHRTRRSLRVGSCYHSMKLFPSICALLRRLFEWPLRPRWPSKSASYFPIVISSHDQRAEAKTSTALHDLGATVDKHDFFRRIALCRGSPIWSAEVWSSA